MGRQKVIQITCDRCTRVEHQPISDIPEDGVKMFSGQFMGEEIEYTDLCTGCRTIVQNRWDTIKKELIKSSPIRKFKRGERQRMEEAKKKSETARPPRGP